MTLRIALVAAALMAIPAVALAASLTQQLAPNDTLSVTAGGCDLSVTSQTKAGVTVACGPAYTPTPSAQPGQKCPDTLHASITTAGPDSKSYPTWHGATDPTTGCHFGHEHGADPRTSKAKADMPPFGYVGGLIDDDEPHEGFKVFILHNGQNASGFISNVDSRIVFHMGTSGVGRYTTRFHSMMFDHITRDGTGREFHIMGMADTGTHIGSTCDLPRVNGRDFATLGCNDPYEIWQFKFSLSGFPNEFTDEFHSRLWASGAVAAFDPITTRNPQDHSQLRYTDIVRGTGQDPMSASAVYKGCRREAYFGPNYFQNSGKPTVYYSDVYGKVNPSATAPSAAFPLRQEVAAVSSTNNRQFKYEQNHCSPGVFGAVN